MRRSVVLIIVLTLVEPDPLKTARTRQRAGPACLTYAAGGRVSNSFDIMGRSKKRKQNQSTLEDGGVVQHLSDPQSAVGKHSDSRIKSPGIYFPRFFSRTLL